MEKQMINLPYSEIKEKLKNVYFIIGTAYAGKSTMVKMLSEHCDGIMCKENYSNDYFEEYGVNSTNQPNLCYTNNHTMEEFVSRTPDEYYNWLRSCELEAAPIELSILINLTATYPDKKIFVDTSIPMDILKEISDFDHVAVMLSEQSMSVDRFFERPDYEKQLIFRAIKKTKNPEATMENYKKILEKANSIERYNEFLNSGFYVFKRDDKLSLEQTRDVLEQHFKIRNISR